MPKRKKKKDTRKGATAGFQTWCRDHEKVVIVLFVIVCVAVFGSTFAYQRLVSSFSPFGVPSSQEDDYYRDITRSLHLAAVAQDLEQYKGKTGYYPTLAQINDVYWRESNTYDYKDSYFGYQDPEGSNVNFAAKPTPHMYSYQPSGCTVKGCSGFVLTAILHDGTQIHKDSVQ